MKANHEDAWAPMKTGRGETQVFVNRGQFIFGRKTASKELKMDESTIYKRMQKLKNMRNCNIESNTHYSLVTVLNYEPYQGFPKDKVTGKVTTKEQPSNTNNNDNNENNVTRRSKKQTDPRVKEFFDFWDNIWLKQIGCGYVHSYGMEGKMLKALLKVYDLNALQKNAQDYFRDERCQQRGIDLKNFFYEMNRRASLKAMNPLAQARREQGHR